ncbi:MAG: AAA family ATPase [Bradyrhizobium sp.]|uniref:AAA family ATPase n=1 Tax=Bradyrhizobium sp. TaxID=376 RepID=UPI003D10A10B
MKVVRLQAENIKRLVAVDITPDGAIVQITGKNGAGKSSVLDSIWYALGGERNIPGEPVRKGEKKARVTLDLGDIIVERRFTEHGTTLSVTNAEGLKYSSPQKVLDALCGRLTFDPLEFSRQKPADQADTLARLVGLDLSDIEKKRAAAYQERRDINRDIVRLTAECAALPKVEPELGDLAAAEQAVREARLAETRRQSIVMALSAARNALTAARQKTQECDAAVVQAKAAATAAEREETAARAKLAELEGMPAEPAVDVDSAIEAARLASAQDAEHARWKAAEERRKVLLDAEQASQNLTAKIDALDTEAAAKIAACTFPLPDLAIVDGVVRYRDMPFDQCSSAEQLRVSTAIAMAMNPKLRVIRISDGSLLDSDSLAMLSDLATEQDYQVWLETVDSDDQSAVVIVDGQVAHAAAEEAA